MAKRFPAIKTQSHGKMRDLGFKARPRHLQIALVAGTLGGHCQSRTDFPI